MQQINVNTPESLIGVIRDVQEHFSSNEKAAQLFENCFLNTYQTTLTEQPDGTTFVVTGDIPAMWLRDSAAQVRPYLMVASKDPEIARMLKGVIRRQFDYILHDPYANAFNETASGAGHHEDKTEMSPIVWERKYEIDSLCYPIQLAYLYWKETGDASIFDETFVEVVQTVLKVWKTEQNHDADSAYRFERPTNIQSDTLTHDGKGADTAYTGMTWSGFRPSDDACLYGYLVPANMFAVVVLGYAQEICESIGQTDLSKKCAELAQEIRNGIEEYGTIEHPIHGRVYVYETDGKGHYTIMDDANVPSLMSAPYLGYCDFEDDTYQNTRRLILSRENPYYYEGTSAKGIGSPHTPDHYVWHIALSVQGLTSMSIRECEEIFHYLTTTDGGEGYMHEGFNASDPTEYTRSWFAWSNTMFSEFLLSLTERAVKGSPLYAALKRRV